MNERILRVTLFLSLLLLCALTVLAESPGKSAVGNWRLDLSQSSYGKAPAPKFEKLNIITDAPTATKWMITGATADGKTFTVSYDGPIDGRFHPLISNDGATVAYQRVARGPLSWTVKDKDGNVIETAVGRLSPDGETLTLTGTRTSQRGSADFVAVYSRIQ